MKFFASKRIQRVTNFGLALMLVVSTVSASVPFLFAQKASALGGSTALSDANYVVDQTVANNGDIVAQNANKPSYSTIGAAVLAAANNTTIVVKNGTYVENVSLSVNGKSIALKAENKHQAIIKGSVVVKWSGPYTLDGFSIESPNITNDYGIWVYKATGASITNNKISNISTNSKGVKGIFVGDSVSTYSNVLIENNEISNITSSTQQASGILVNGSASGITVRNNVIKNVSGSLAYGVTVETVPGATFVGTVSGNNIQNSGVATFAYPGVNVAFVNNITGPAVTVAPTDLKFYKGTTEVPAGTVLNVANGSKTVELKWQSTGAINQYSTRVSYPDGTSEEHWTGTKGLWIGQTAYVSNKFGLKGEGVYKYETKARSATTGLWSAWSAPTTLTYDSKAPTLGDVTYGTQTLTAGSVIGGTKSFSVNLNELHPDRTYVEVDVLNNGVWSKIDGSWSTGTAANTATFTLASPLAQYGKQYQLKVSTYDIVGNHSSFTIPFTVDNVRPSVSIIAPTHMQFTKNANTINFRAHDDANLASVEYGIVGQGVPVTVAASGKDQDFSVPVGTFNLADGTYTFRMTAKDTAGNISVTADRPFKVDNTAPGVPTLVAPTPVGNAILGTGAFLIDWSDATDAGSGVAHYEYQAATDAAVEAGVLVNPIFKSIDNQGPLTSSQVQASGTPDGTYYWQVRAVDNVGNYGSWSAIGTLTVDTLPPQKPVVSATGVEDEDSTNNSSIEINWSAPAGAVKYDYRVWTNAAGSQYNSENTAYPSDGLTANSRTGGFTEGEGSYFVQVRAYDAAGNVSGWSETFTVVYDNTDPVVGVNSLATTDNTPELTGSIDDETATVTVTVNDATYEAVVSGSTWSFTLPVTDDGTYGVSVVATDPAGNESVVATGSLKIDTTSPTVVITVPAVTLTADTTPTITGTYASNDGFNDTIVTISVDDGSAVPVIDNGDGTWSYTPATALTQGVHTFVATASDALENSSNSELLRLTIDSAAPAVAINTVTSEGNTPTITGTAEAGVILSVTFNGSTSTITNDDGVWTFTSPTALENGTYAFSITATDAAGNTSTSNSSVVVAVVPPAITQSFTVTPTITNPGSAVLGATTDSGVAAQSGAADVAGASTENVAAAADSDANNGTIFGLAWYWWILILAALAALAWFIIGAVRRRNEA